MRTATAIAILLACLAAPVGAQEAADERPPEIIYVPQGEMDALLDRHERGVVLGVAEYLELWRAAKEGRLAPTPRPAADAVILSGRLTGEVGEKVARIRAEYRVRVLAEGMVKVPFPLSGVGVREALADDREALLTSEGGTSFVLLVGKGDHRIVLDLEARVARSEDLLTLDLALPLGATVSTDLRIPEGTEPAAGSVGWAARVVEAEDGPHLVAHLPPTGQFQLALRPRRDEEAGASLVLAEGRTLHTVGSRLVRTVSLTEAILHRPVRELALGIPAGSIVTEVAAPDLAGWSPVGAVGIRLRFGSRVSGTVPIVVRMETVREGPGDVVLPEVLLNGASDHRGLTAVRFESGVSGRIVASEGYARVVIPASRPEGRQAAPAPGPILHGAAAAYRYWAGGRRLVVRTEEPERRIDADVAVSLRLTAADREVRAEFRYRPEGERVFSLSPGLPALFDLESVEVVAPVAHRWEEREDGRLLVQFPAGCAPGSEIVIRYVARLANEEWRAETWESTSFPLPVPDPGIDAAATSWVEGRVAVFAAEEFRVRESDVEGLRAEPVEVLGAPGARLGWTFRGRETPTGRLTITRRDPKVTVRHVAVVAPGEKTARYSGFLHYTIERAGVRRFRFTVSGGHGDRLNVTAPLGAEPLRRRLPDGTDLWRIELPDRVMGEVLIPFTLEETMESDGDGRAFRFPVVTPLDAESSTAWLAVETGENLKVEIDAAAGLRETALDLPAGYVPRRALLAAWQATGPEWDLSIRVTRHEDMPVLTAFVTRARILSVVGEDGTVRSRAVYRLLNTGRQFLVVRLGESSSLWAAHVGGKPVKPVKGADGYLVPLPTTGDGEATEVSLVWESGGFELESSGTLSLSAPELLGVLGAEADWRVYLPSDVEVLEADGVFGGRPPAPPKPWIVRAVGDLFDNAALVQHGSDVGARAVVESSWPVNGQEVVSRLQDAPAEDPGWKAAEKEAEDLDRRREDQPGAMPKPAAPPEAAPEPQRSGGEDGAEMPGDEQDAGATGGKRPGGPGGTTPPAPPARLAKAGSLPIDVRFTEAGTLRRVDALGIRGSLRIRYLDRPARDALGWVVSVLVVIAGVLLTGQLRRGGPGAGSRIPPLLYVVGLGGLATFAPAWFGVSDPTVWDGIARGAVLTAGVLLLAGLVRAIGRLRVPGKAAAAALLLLALLAPAARAGDGEKIYVPYDPDNLGNLDSEGKVFLPFERFRELWNAAHPERRIGPQDEAPVPWVVSGVAYEGSVEGETASITATFDLVLLREGWTEVALPLSPAVVESATSDGEPVRVLARGGAQVLVMEGRGPHRVVLELRAGIARDGDGRSLSMHLPAIPRTRLTFRLPSADLDVDLAGWVEPQVEGNLLTAFLGPSGGFRLAWRPKTEAPEMAARVEAETREALVLREGRTELRLRTTWRVVTGGIRELEYSVAGEHELVGVEGSDVKSWSRDGDRLSVALAREVRDATVVTLTLLRPDGVRTRTVEVPLVAPLGAVRERGVFAVAAPPELRVTAGNPRNLERIAAAAGDFGGLLPPGCDIHSAWRFVIRPLALDVASEPVRGEVRAVVSGQHLVGRDWLRCRAIFQFTVRDDGNFEFPVRVPEGLEIVSVTGEGLARWWREGDVLTLTTANPVRGNFRVDVEARRRLDPDAVTVELPEFHALDVTRESGRILVAHAPNLSLTLVADDGLVKEDVAGARGWPKIDARQTNVYAWRQDGGAYRAAVARSFPKPRVRPVATTRLQVLDDSVVVATGFVFEIENAGEDTFRVFFPEGESAEPIVAAERTRSITWEDGERDGRPGRILTVVLQQPVLGTYAFRVVTEKRLDRDASRPNEGAVSVRGPVPYGENPLSFVIVENQSNGEVRVGATTGLDRGEPEKFPYIPAGMDPRLLTAGFKARAAEWSADLTLVIHDFAAFPDLLVSTAEILVAVGRDGWTRNRATWSVLNRTRQFLEISLPDESVLEAVRVGGRVVKPGRRDAEDGERILIPLSRMRPGDVSTTVEVTWSRYLPGTGRGLALADLGRLEIEEPVLHGFEVEQTFLTVCLPEGWSYSFDGNMRPATEADIAVWNAQKSVEELERLADVQLRGSFAQSVVATENFYEVREDLERQLAKARVRLSRDGEKAQEVAKVQREALLLDQTVAGQTAQVFNLRTETTEQDAAPDDAEQTIARTRELAENRRQQEYRFKGKQEVASQEWSRNYRGPEGEVPPSQRDPSDPQPPPSGPSTGSEMPGGGEARPQEDSPVFFGGGAEPHTRLPVTLGAGGYRVTAGGGGGGGAAVNLDGVTNGLVDRSAAGFDDAGGRRAGLLSLPVTVPERGTIRRFEKRGGDAELVVDVSRPGDGRGATGFGLFVLLAGALVAWYRWRPHERYRGFRPVCLIVFGILAGVLVPAGELLFIPVLIVVGGGIWLTVVLRKSESAPRAS